MSLIASYFTTNNCNAKYRDELVLKLHIHLNLHAVKMQYAQMYT